MDTKHIETIWGSVVVALASILVGLIVVDMSHIETPETYTQHIYKKAKKMIFSELPIEEKFIPPPPPDIARMKTQGCVFDGLLSEYGKTSKLIKLAQRSECYYYHRALETWLDVPDFDEAQETIAKIGKKDVVYGMFIAEAIDIKEEYEYPAEYRDFKFRKMCRKGSENYWGEHTCQPSLERSEYRRYVQHITREAMDIGIQSFMFGQVFYQDSVGSNRIKEVIEDMRAYADLRGIEIVVGAQTNDITKEEYLRQFDFIEGGVGLYANGNIEHNACFSRWWKKPGDWCWALLWHERFSSKANNVFIHLDWSGKSGDDMSTFARMNKPLREATIKKLHAYFTSQDIGFLVPFFTPLPDGNGGCHGEKERYYSADNRYTCDDEDFLNQLLQN
jgi:hypothetical protein